MNACADVMFDGIDQHIICYIHLVFLSLIMDEKSRFVQMKKLTYNSNVESKNECLLEVVPRENLSVEFSAAVCFTN